MALSLNRHMPDKEFDIVIYYTSLSRQNRNAILNIKNVIVREFHFPKDFIDKMLANLPKGRWNNENSLLTAAHYEIFKLLDEYETVIWLDSDFSIQGDIYDLVNYGPLGLCKDCCWEKIWSVGDQFTSPIAGYDMTRESYLNALIVVNDQLPNYRNLIHHILTKLNAYETIQENID